MEKELNPYFPTVIVGIIASYLPKFKGNNHTFPNENILGYNMIYDDKIYTYNHDTLYVLDLEGNLLFSKTFNYINNSQVLKDGNLLVISDTRLYVYDTTKWLEIISTYNQRLVTSYYPSVSGRSNFYYHVLEYENYILICRVNPYTGEKTEAKINSTVYPHQIKEYDGGFIFNNEKTIYFVMGKRVKEIPIFGKIVSYVNITEDGLLYYISSTEENYYLTFSNGKIIKLSLDRKLYIEVEIMLLVNRIFLITRDVRNRTGNIMALDTDDGMLIYSKQGDHIKMIGLLSGYFAYTYYHDVGSNIDLIRISNGEIVSTHNIKSASYIDKTVDDKLIFFENHDVMILS